MAWGLGPGLGATDYQGTYFISRSQNDQTIFHKIDLAITESVVIPEVVDNKSAEERPRSAGERI
jgi:hypothetical protein